MSNKLKCDNCGNENLEEFSLLWRQEKYFYITGETNTSLNVELVQDGDDDGFYECTCVICGSEVDLIKNLDFGF